MNETAPSETKPKKMVSRSVAIALGIICIILAVSLVGAFAYYMPMINDKDNTISSLDSQLSNLDGNFSNYRLLKDFTVVASNQTVNPFNNYTGGYVGYGFDFSALYSGYVSVAINDSTENPTTVRLIYYNLGYPFEYELEIPTGGTSYFPVTGSPEPSGPIEGTTGFIIILFKNTGYAYDQATVTIVYYY
jgi:type II secretory pathway pseudopilin PulG